MPAAPNNIKGRSTSVPTLLGASDVSSTLLLLASHNRTRPVRLYNWITMLVLGFAFLSPLDISYASQYDTNFPDVIYCEVNQAGNKFDMLFFYGARDKEDYNWGDGLDARHYFSPTDSYGQRFAFASTGSFILYTDTIGATTNCDGLSINSLYSSNKAFNFAPISSTSSIDSSATSSPEEIQALSQLTFYTIILFLLSVLSVVWLAKTLKLSS